VNKSELKLRQIKAGK